MFGSQERLKEIISKDKDYRLWQYIILHHSATADRRLYNDWENIRNYHINNLGWNDVGYHYGIERDQGSVVIRSGRDLKTQGAHSGLANTKIARNSRNMFNDFGIGICLIGNFNLDYPEDNIWKESLKLTRKLMNIFNIHTDRVLGHRETYKYFQVNQLKNCPGKYFNLERFRKEL